MPSADGKLNLNIPFGVLSSLMFLLVQLVGVVIWASNEHSQRVELQHQFEEFKSTMRDRAKTIDMAIDRIDTNGSRGLAIVQDRQNINVARANQVEERVNSSQARLNIIGEFIAKLDARVDALEKYILVNPPQSKPPDAKPPDPPPTP
jgi:hypothetical protein